jgi:uncharacterized protein (TIGR01244 family)
VGNTKINDEVTVGGQPTEEQLQELARQGFKSVVNFRTEGEADQPVSPGEEGAQALAAGLEYLHLPVSMKALDPATVDQFRQRYRELPKPIFAHCKGGTRAGAMVMMHLASEQGMSGQQTLDQAEQMGFKCDQPALKQFVQQYVDNQTKRGA